VRRIPAVVALACVVHACAAHTGPPVAPVPHAAVAPPAAAAADLRRDLDAIFSADAVAHAHWGVHVVSLRTGETLYDLNARRYFVPASNQKIVTAAVAAERLGWDYRFTTRILATAPIDSSGTLDGDLIVTGNGDPSINPRHPQRAAVFDEWAAALAAKGLHRVTGRLVGDDRAVARPGWGAGWAWDDLQYGYSAAPTALQFNENQVDVLVGPGMNPGAPGVIATAPSESGVFTVNRVVTVDAGAERQLDTSRVPGTPFLHVIGQVPADSPAVALDAAVDSPTVFYVRTLDDALRRHGVVVVGDAVEIGQLRGELDRVATTELLVDRSPPLSELVDVCLKWSRNGYAETMLLALSPPGEPQTATAGLAALAETLRAWGVEDEIATRDGSGLSRYDLVTPHAFTSLLAHIAGDPRLYETFRSTLPEAGVSGSLANRMKGTSAAGRVFAKTGSMTGVRGVSGYLSTTSGEPCVFSILVNNYRVPAGDIEALTDRALVRLVEFKRQEAR